MIQLTSFCFDSTNCSNFDRFENSKKIIEIFSEKVPIIWPNDPVSGLLPATLPGKNYLIKIFDEKKIKNFLKNPLLRQIFLKNEENFGEIFDFFDISFDL